MDVATAYQCLGLADDPKSRGKLDVIKAAYRKMAIKHHPDKSPPEEMASRHRVRFPEVQIIKTHVLENHQCRRESTTMFHDDAVKFPDGNKHIRCTSKTYKTTFKAVRPTVNL